MCICKINSVNKLSRLPEKTLEMASKMALDRYSKYATSTVTVAVGASCLGWLVLSRLNQWYSRRVLNNATSDSSWNWSKEIVLLTGGSGGIGAAIADELAKRRVKVIIVDVHAPPHAELRTERRVDLVIAPANFLTDANQYFYKLNVSSSSEIAEVAAQIRKEHGEPTVLINNAGIGNAKPILELPENRLRSIFDINIIAHFLLLQEFLPAMVKSNHGHIVSLASMASFSTQATNVDYAATKAGVLVLHEGLAQELRFVYNAPKVRTT
jgi:NADP-dependent 3-hydroxy acid dehydrogenase YdfG